MNEKEVVNECYQFRILCNLRLTSKIDWNYGDLQLLPEVDHLPHLEVPYPNTNGGQHFRRASGSCPVILLHECKINLH